MEKQLTAGRMDAKDALGSRCGKAEDESG